MSETTSPKTCTRCHGKGSIEGFGYIDGGRCWACLGKGTLEAQQAAKRWAPVKSVRIERRNSLGGPIDITISTLEGTYKVSAHTTDGLLIPVETFATLDEARTAANAAYRTVKEMI